jgi:hypothetical protein
VGNFSPELTFASYVASWIVDVRFFTKRYVVDDILALVEDPEIRVDVALLAKLAPRWSDVVAAVASDARTVERIADYLADGHADLGAVTALAEAFGSIMVHESMLQALPARASIARYINVRDERPSFVGNKDFRKELNALVERACHALAIPFVARDGSEFVLTRGRELRVPIVREPLLLRTGEPADTLAGLVSSVRHAFDDDARMLLAVVLASSERLPYIEGRVDAVKQLREQFESFASACGQKATLGNFRHAFYSLGRGDRAVWILEPDVAEAIDVKMNQVVARFVKGLQHALYGTNARRTVIEAIAVVLAKRSGGLASELVDALAEVCGATSSVFPSLPKDAVA